MKKILIVLILEFLFIVNVNAASLCSYEEQRSIEQEAANVNIGYELKSNKITYSDGDLIEEYIKVSIYNISERLYIEVNTEDNSYSKTYSFEDAIDNVISFDWKELGKTTSFIIQVFSSAKTSCPKERFKTLYYIAPKYNEFSRLAICDSLEDFYLCQKLVTFDEISYSDFYTKLYEYKDKSVKKDDSKKEDVKISDKFFEFIDKYKYYFIGGVLIIIASSYTTYKIKTKKQRELGL